MSIKEDIEKTYRRFDKIFTSQLGKPLKEFQMSQIRDQFKVWITKENPLFLGEYHQAFRYSNFFADFGYTDGYKKTSASKKPGQKSHFFTKFVKNFKGRGNSENTFVVSFGPV